MLNMVLMEVPEKAAVQLYSFAEWPPLRKRKSPQYSAERPLTQTASRWKIKAFLSHQAQVRHLLASSSVPKLKSLGFTFSSRKNSIKFQDSASLL